MLETLANLDLSLFRFLNMSCANPVTNAIMPIMTNEWFLRIGYLAVMILILWKGPKDRRWLVVGSVLALAASDLFASALFKPLIERPRPCHSFADINLLVNCGAGFSMPSSHAANAFAQWIFWSRRFPAIRWYLLLVAFLIAVSRIFVGVHYPADILFGAAIGFMCGLTLSLMVKKVYTGRRKD